MDKCKQKNETTTDASKLVKGIVCDVKSCAYHKNESSCYAGCVSVGPCDASCSANTVCATFKPREI